MSGPAGRDAALAGPATVFFLSDYGLADEFVGVCHVVVRRHAPQAAVVDLTHGIPPFDVAAGAEALLRAVPHLGPGVVLGVVDPGVGAGRRGVVLEAVGAPRWFVGPDNGLLVPAAEWAGALVGAWTLPRPPDAPATFDGRDVFAPAAAALAIGVAPERLGRPLDPSALRRVDPPLFEASGAAGRSTLRAQVVWVDRFGNAQLAAPATSFPAPEGATVGARVRGQATVAALTRVRAFGDLSPGGLGLLSDANGRLALVVREGSAAMALGAAVGDVVELVWPGPGQ